MGCINMTSTNLIAELTPIIKEGILSEPSRPPNTPINEQDIPAVIHICYSAFLMNLLEHLSAGKPELVILDVMAMADSITKHNKQNN